MPAPTTNDQSATSGDPKVVNSGDGQRARVRRTRATGAKVVLVRLSKRRPYARAMGRCRLAGHAAHHAAAHAARLRLTHPGVAHRPATGKFRGDVQRRHGRSGELSAATSRSRTSKAARAPGSCSMNQPFNFPRPLVEYVQRPDFQDVAGAMESRATSTRARCRFCVIQAGCSNGSAPCSSAREFSRCSTCVGQSARGIMAPLPVAAKGCLVSAALPGAVHPLDFCARAAMLSSSLLPPFSTR